MARIRTVKPEFPQSESMGRVSRDARLLFVMLWTICDDAGRARGNSRMLASLLFPYDDDAPSLIDGWLTELEQEGCVRRYEADGSTYIDLPNWLKHQKIDKPSPSRLPQFVEPAREVANIREASSLDLVPGPRTMDQDQPEEARVAPQPAPNLFEPKPEPPPPKTKRGTRWGPDRVVPDEWIEAGRKARQSNNLPAIDLRLEASKFAAFWASKAGAGGSKVDWFLTWKNWCLNARSNGNANASSRAGGRSYAPDDSDLAAFRLAVSETEGG